MSRVVERWCYDPYGRPLIRESVGRGDMDNDTDMDSTDYTRVTDAKDGNIWDPRADLDDDGDVDRTDANTYLTKDNNWPPQSTSTVVAQAFSDVGNPFGFQGRVHFAIDTAAAATDATLFLVDHRERMNEPVTGRWLTRDPIGYWDGMNLYEYLVSNPLLWLDPYGLCAGGGGASGGGTGMGIIGKALAKLAKATKTLKKAWQRRSAARKRYQSRPNAKNKKKLDDAERAYEKAYKEAQNAAQEADTVTNPTGNTMQRRVETIHETGKTPAQLAAEKAIKKKLAKHNEPGQGQEQIESAQRKSRQGKGNKRIDSTGKAKQRGNQERQDQGRGREGKRG